MAEAVKAAEWLVSEWAHSHRFASAVSLERQKLISENPETGHLAPLDDDCNPQVCRQ